MRDRIKDAIDFAHSKYPEASDVVLAVLLDQSANRSELSEQLSNYVREKAKTENEAEKK